MPNTTAMMEHQTTLICAGLNRGNAVEGIVAIYTVHNQFPLNKICLNQTEEKPTLRYQH